MKKTSKPPMKGKAKPPEKPMPKGGKAGKQLMPPKMPGGKNKAGVMGY